MTLGNRPVNTRVVLLAFALAGLLVWCRVTLSAQAGPSSDRTRVITLVVRPHGFEPGTITAAAGRTILHVLNRTGATALDLQLDRLAEGQQAGQRLKREVLTRWQRPWRNVLELAPGTYLVSEASHPDWTCRIRVPPASN